ncbi:MAG TPA: FtsX-like permease family protein [Candidatus Dormibacteraeota bacterium]|nr:FtsX-like permease family protein [Candidatus Dormibacteraeota bacterium]
MTSFFGIPPVTLASWMAGAVGAVLLLLLAFAAVNRVLLRMALRNIPRRRAQTVLILFGLMLATLITTASLSVGDTSAYSLQSIQLRQMGAIDEAFTRFPASQYVQGASTDDSAFFSDAQTADVKSRSLADPDIAAVVPVIATSGSMVDTTSSQSESGNVGIYGVPADFGSVWGPLHGQNGASLDVAKLPLNQVFIGATLASTLNAHAGDVLQLYVDGHLTYEVVAGVLDTEINPSIANHGPILNSVLMPIATMRTVIGRPAGYNLIFVHNRGTGGIDDLGPTDNPDAYTMRLSAQFTDPQSAAELWSFLRQPDIKTQIQKIHDSATFIDPDQDLSRRLLVELNKPAVSDEFKAMAQDRFVQRIMLNAVGAAAVASGGDTAAQAAASDLYNRVQALSVDSAAASDLRTFLQQPAVAQALTSLAASLPSGDPAHDGVLSLLQEVEQPGLSPAFKAAAGSPDFQKTLARAIAAVAPDRLADLKGITNRLNLYTFSPYKADAVLFAQRGGLFTAGALLGVSFFSIAVGVLLIFLIFVMLAAERRAEMGMSRAVGLKRRHLTQMFLFEGVAYTLGAGVIGMVLGVGVGALMVRVISSIFTGFYKGMDLTFHVEWTSLVLALCLGILMTFIVVAVSAYRVSRLNIVAAIRDLDESESRDVGLWRMFKAPFATAWFAFKQLWHGHPLVFLGRVTLGTLGAIRTFWWSLFRRGPLTILLGLGLVALNLSDFQLSHLDLLYDTGASLVIIGTGLLVRWMLQVARVRNLVASRVGFTIAAIGLLVFWGRPFGRIEDKLGIASSLQLDKNNGGAEVFVLSALMTLLGAIWLVMYNSDLLISVVMLITGRIRALAPVTRTSMAYPMSTKFRTGMAVAMFAIVTFIVVYTSVFKDVLTQNFGQVGAQTGHWQVVAGSPDFSFNQTDRTVFPTDVAGLVASDPTTSRDVSGVGWENLSGVGLHEVRPDGTIDLNSGTRGYSLHIVDDGYLNATGYAIQPRAVGYSSDRAVWDAVRDNVGYAVLDTSALDSANSGPATVTGIKATDATFTPFQVQVGNGEKGGAVSAWRVTVVGFMTKPIWDGLYVSTRTAVAGGNFSAPGMPPATQNQSPAQALSSPPPVLSPTGYYFALRSGVDANQARLALGRLLVKDQLEPVVSADEVAQQLTGILTLLNLITGFLALGLIVGIAGLGVISTRAVVERWQQIGMLRALGFRRALVQRSFLMESSLIAILGLLIGTLLGLWESYRFFVVDKTFGTVDFHIPALEITLILIAAYLATLVTTYLPSRAASRVAPAEALRYE